LSFAKNGDLLLLIGKTKGHLGASLYAREIAGREDGAPPDVNLETERRNGDFVRDQIEKGVTCSVHDLSDGGLWVAVAEMALAGNLGANIEAPKSNTHAFLFGEDQARYVITCAPQIATRILSEAAARNVPAETIGQVDGKTLTVNGQYEIDLQELRDDHEGWLPTYMG
jgi:phosphoribosylformylglycinamidine synthase